MHVDGEANGCIPCQGCVGFRTPLEACYFCGYLPRRTPKAAIWMTNEQKILDLRGKHKGESVLVLGNGPTLSRNDLSRVPPDVTIFGTNRSWTEVKARYHAISDRVHIRELAEGLWKPRFLFSGIPKIYWPEGVEGVQFATTIFQRVDGRLSPVFSEDLAAGISMGGTPFVVLQICAWMGFRNVFLAGIDLEPDLETGQGHHYPGKPMYEGMKDEQTWNLSIAKEALDRLRVRVVNLNPRSLLEIWPRVPFEEVFP